MIFDLQKNNRNGKAVYRQIATQLKQMIAEGTLQSGDRLPPEPEFAKQLGVNRMTLRKSLQILLDERLLIKTPSKGTFIRPVEERKHRIGIIFPKGENNSFDWYTTVMARSITSAVKKYENCGTAILSIEANETPDQFFRKIIRSGVEGGVAIMMESDEGKILSDPIFAGVPIVSLGVHEISGIPSVDLVENQMEPAIRRLVESGHRKIAYISCCSTSAHCVSRDRNFIELQQRYQLVQNPDYYIRCASEIPWFIQGMNTAEKLLSLPEPPTAIVSNSRTIINGVWNKLLMMGCRIPEDISVIGFDNRCLENPLVASLEQPIRQMTQKCVDLLFERIEKGHWNADAHYQFPVELYEGKSIGVCHE